MIGCEQTGAPDCGLSWRTFGIAFAVHVALFLFFWGMGIINFRKPDVIIPIDMTIVPPWAQQTDDPEPDPNPPPPEVKQVKPPPKAPEPEKVEVKPKVEAVEKVVEKKKPEKVDLKKNAKLIKKPKPEPPQKNLKDKAKVVTPKPVPVERPPDLKIPDTVKKFGKGTANDKPLKDIDMKKMLEQGYRYGAKNQLAASEEQRCASLIRQAILREWNKESFKWYSGLRPIQVTLQLGSGGKVSGFSILSGSGDADVDRTAQSALNRLKGQKIIGLTAQFIEQFPQLTIVMEPTQGR
jgi:outer membrane biosynthesis protein TonB